MGNNTDQLMPEAQIDDYTKGIFASMETSGRTSGDYLQLEKSTFMDLKKRGLVSPETPFTHLKYQPVYDKVAAIYLGDLMHNYKIPTVEEAALWSWRPAWYQKYKGNIDAIPEDKKGVMGKTAREIMYQRAKALDIFVRKQTASVAPIK